ncbi:fimbrial protein [Salmonella enterica subsp. enterica serovar Ramatgan]|nr:fimbrial protein [Salmonella enterica subsp. enterica serovar Ramatgan]
MMKLHLYKLFPLAGILFLGSGHTAVREQQLSVDYTATIEEMTCVITITAVGSTTLTSSGNAAYILTLPEMGVLDISNRTSLSEGNFRLLPTECNNNISSLTMTITGTTSVSSYLIDGDTGVANAAENIALGFKPMGSDDGSRVKVDGSQKVTWTNDQVKNGYDLSAMIRRSNSSAGPLPGEFSAKATFVFTYQ